MSEYKLVLASDNTGKSYIRYRKLNELTWSTLYIDNIDINEIIEEFLQYANTKINMQNM